MTLKLANSRVIWIAGLATLLASLQLVILNTYIVILLQEDLLTSIAIITVIISLRNILQLFFRIPMGELSQIIGRKPLILFGHFSYTIALILTFFASNWIYILIAIIFVALGMSGFWPGLFAYISDFSLDEFGEANGRIFQMSDVGGILGSFLATVILDELLFDLRFLFGVIAIIGFFSGILSYLILPESLEHKNKKSLSEIFRILTTSFLATATSLRSVSRKDSLFQVYIYQFILSFVEFMISTFLPVMIVSKGYSRGDVSEISFWALLLIIWFKPRLGSLTDKYNFKLVISSTILIATFAIFLFGLVDNYWLLIILYVILNAALITGYTAENGETSRRSTTELRGTALGALGVYVSLGRASSTIILGPVWEMFGLLSVFGFTAVGVTFITILLNLYYKRSKN